jgi:hypothetical protein
MIQKISAPVSVELVYDHRKHTVLPRKILWDGRIFPTLKIGLHHTYREGRELVHIFSIASDSLSFRLKLDTTTLFWTLEEISDGLPN